MPILTPQPEPHIYVCWFPRDTLFPFAKCVAEVQLLALSDVTVRLMILNTASLVDVGMHISVFSDVSRYLMVLRVKEHLWLQPEGQIVECCYDPIVREALQYLVDASVRDETIDGALMPDPTKGA